MNFKDFYNLNEAPYSFMLPKSIERLFINDKNRQSLSPTINPSKMDSVFDFNAEFASVGSPYRDLFNWSIYTKSPDKDVPFWDRQQNVIYMVNTTTGKSRPISKLEKEYAEEMKNNIFTGFKSTDNEDKATIIKNAVLIFEPEPETDIT